MKPELLKWLVDPLTGEALDLTARSDDGPEIVAGRLTSKNGAKYRIVAGIPRLVASFDEKQLRTSDAFGFKWAKLDTYESAANKHSNIEWMLPKYNFATVEDWARFYDDRERVLDIGCGSGYTSSLWLDSPGWTGKSMWVGVDISTSVDVARDRLRAIPNVHLVQADALTLPFPDATFGAIISEGVLHHTPSTRLALLAGARVLATGGEFHFYVYRRKGPVREFTDDYIREAIADLSEEEAWEQMRGLTELGKVLSELDAEVTLERGIPLLGIPAGKHNVQRLVYWHFAKLFWKADLSFEENVHCNFDWYRPRYAHRQSAEEVRDWCAEAGLRIDWFHEQESGFTVKAVKG